MTCETCGAELTLGAWPWCPHGRSAMSVVADTVPGGFVVENGFETPRRFDSRSQHAKALAARGLEVRAVNMGPHDQICQRWDTVDLDAAAVLVSRGTRAPVTLDDEPVPITVRELDGPGIRQKVRP